MITPPLFEWEGQIIVRESADFVMTVNRAEGFAPVLAAIALDSICQWQLV